MEKSGFLDFIDEGDLILADRGFPIDHLLVEKGARLLMPSMLHGKSAMTIHEESLTKVIAKSRIHIERWNRRLKHYQFLKGPLSYDKRPLISQAVYVCSCLANFSRLLLKSL